MSYACGNNKIRLTLMSIYYVKITDVFLSKCKARNQLLLRQNNLFRNRAG